MTRKHISVLLFCLYLGAVAALCFVHGEQLPDLPSKWLGIPADKVMHALMFLPFPILAFQAFHSHDKRISGSLILLAVSAVVGAGVAVATEKLQGILEYRTYESLDLIADFIGIIAGTLICSAYIVVRMKRR